MLLEEIKKLKIKADSMEIGDGVGIFIRTLPYISAIRFYQATPETWDKIKITTRGGLLKALKWRVQILQQVPNFDETIREETIVLMMYLYPKEYQKAYRLNFSRMDSERKKLTEEIIRVLELHYEEDEQRKDELV